jgi:hypothetical protein
MFSPIVTSNAFPKFTYHSGGPRNGSQKFEAPRGPLPAPRSLEPGEGF